MRFSLFALAALSAASASAAVTKRDAPAVLAAIAGLNGPIATFQAGVSGYPTTATYAQIDASADGIIAALDKLLAASTASAKISAADGGKIGDAFEAQEPAIKKAIDTLNSKKAQVTKPAEIAHIKEELHHFKSKIGQVQAQLSSKLTLDGALATRAQTIFKTIDGYFAASIAAWA